MERARRIGDELREPIAPPNMRELVQEDDARALARPCLRGSRQENGGTKDTRHRGRVDAVADAHVGDDACFTDCGGHRHAPPARFDALARAHESARAKL